MADEELKTPYVNTFLDKRDFCKEQIQEKKRHYYLESNL